MFFSSKNFWLNVILVVGVKHSLLGLEIFVGFVLETVDGKVFWQFDRLEVCGTNRMNSRKHTIKKQALCLILTLYLDGRRNKLLIT